MLPTSASSLSMGTARCDRAPPTAPRQMALLRHRRYGPRFSSATAGARVFRELPEMPHASDEIRQVLVVRQLEPQGETAFHHTDTARQTLLRRYAPRAPASPETPASAPLANC